MRSLRIAIALPLVALVVLTFATGYLVLELHSLGAVGESNDSSSQSEIAMLSGICIPSGAADLSAR
ncbi:MAG TPA: hypothetical protein VHA33_24845 [Candidatus Angelobacter sp.]|jgi:hypothetical protein|nr:hypothetical protein [Candidatus Angelobacter sp.]